MAKINTGIYLILVVLLTSALPGCSGGKSNPATIPDYAISGNIAALQGTITLQNNGTDQLTLNSPGAFSFNNPLRDGANYSVTIQTQPDTQNCTVSNGDGSVSGSDVTNITVSCINTFSVGGTVTGLTGALSLQNNSDALSTSTNGVYVFSERLGDNDSYGVQISQNPAGQICSIVNASGQINNADISNVDIQCASTFSLSGSYQAAPLIQVDSDINDPNAVANISNNTPATTQSIPNFSTVHGFASLSGTGRIAEGDRFANSADEFDAFRVVLQQDQVLRLQVVDFSGANTFLGDLDLLLYDTALNLVAFSNSATEFENVTVPADGEYDIVVQAFSGSSKYTLSLDGVSVTVSGNSNSLDFVPGEALIQFKASSSINNFAASNRLKGLSHRDNSRVTRAQFEINANNLSTPSRLQQPGFEQAVAKRNPGSYQKLKTLQQIKRLNLQQDIEFAEPNYIYHPTAVPSDEFYSFQWHYPSINLPQAWDITTGSRASSDVIVAVVDTGIFLAHPEFSGQLVSGYDFISSITIAADGNGIDSNPDDPGDGAQLGSSSWHGTHVAGTVAALSDNTSGVAGIAWDAKIMPLRALGVGGGTGYDIIQSILFAAGLSNDSGTVPAQKADIINLSLGGSGFSQSEQNAYNAVRAEGVIVVAAAGNNNTSQLSYPASYDGVISVSATDFANSRAPYSNFGTRIDIAAPGGNLGEDLNGDGSGDGILSTLVDDSGGTRNPAYSFYQGTSMAAPHVAGVFALMRAVHPGLSPDNIDDLLSAGNLTLDIGNVGRDDLYGYGLVDALKAVQAAQLLENGGTAPPAPALITASPSQLTLGLGTSALVTLSNQGDVDTNVTGFNSNVGWLSVTASTVDANGLGDYEVLVDRTGLSDSTYIGTITFNLATGSRVDVQVSMQVGFPETTGNAGKIYLLLLDSDGNVVDQISATDRGNGVFNYSFTNVVAGFYRIMAGSDIDNDLIICQLAESCGGYPTINALSTIEVIDNDFSELNFLIDILSNFGTGSLPLETGIRNNSSWDLPDKGRQLNH